MVKFDPEVFAAMMSRIADEEQAESRPVGMRTWSLTMST